MKKKMARTLAVLMCLMTAVAFMPTFAFAEEGAAAEQEGAQQQEQSVDTQAEQPAAEEEAAVETEPAQLAEGGTEETVSAESAEVTFTVSNKGVLASAKDGSVMVNKSVTVDDIDKDGVLSYDEALVALHKKYYNGGEAGYSANGWVTKLWGIETYGNCLFFKNGSLTATVDSEAVEEGDVLYSSVNSDNLNYADWFTAFDVQKISVAANKAFTLTLKGAQGMTYNPDAVRAVAGVKIGTWEEGEFQQITDKITDDSGAVELTFNKPGTYYVTASGTVVDDVVVDWSTEETKKADCPIMAPACVVTVHDDGTVAPSKVDAIKSLTGSYDISKYRSIVHITLLSQVIAGVAEINAAGTPEEVNSALEKALEKIGAIKTDAQMTADENVIRATGISSISVKAGKRKATVKWSRNSKFSGYQIYYKQAGKKAKYTYASSTASSKTIKSLKKGKKYSFKVRGYKKMNGKTIYSNKWSATKTVRIK